MAISQKKANEEYEEEYEDFEEMEIEEEVEDDDYEEAFEEEEEVFEQKEEDEKKVVRFEKLEEEEDEEEESVQELAMEKDETGNRKQTAESDVEQNEEEDEEEEIEQSDEEEEEEKLIGAEKAEEEESVQELAMEKDKTVNRKQTAESDIEQNEEEDEEEIEQEEERVNDVKKVVKVEKLEQEEEESVQESSREEDKTLNRKKPSDSERIPITPPAEFLPLLQSVSDLENLHCALSKFLYEWNSFSRFLGSISSAIDELASSHHDTGFTEQKDLHNEKEKHKDKRSYVEVFCEEMNGKALRKYIEYNSNNIHLLRNEVPEALRRIPNPEKLVLEAIGKFYTQGRKACDNNTQLVLHRSASILLLEFFLLSGRATADSSVRVEANHGALLWWKRLVNENLATASVEDCLGFVLFLACFGISKVFASRDLCFLLMKSDLKKMINVLRRSSILVQKIPGIIKDLIRGEMYYEAAELSCFFELTDTFPPLPLLSSLVARVIQAAKMERERSQAFPNLVRQSDSWELTSLRSVIKFLEYHKFGTDSLDSVHIHKRISELESYIDGNTAVLLNNIRKRKVRNHPTARSKSRARSKKSFPPPKTPQNHPSEMIQNNPEKELPSHPLLENSALSEAVWDRRTYFGSSASYRSLAMESKTLQISPSQMIHKKPEIGFPSHLIFPNSDVENSAVSVAGWGRRAYLESPESYRSPAMECSSGQEFHQRQAFAYGNGGGSGFPGRDLYKFADTVEAQLSKSRRSSNTSPGGAKFGHY